MQIFKTPIGLVKIHDCDSASEMVIKTIDKMMDHNVRYSDAFESKISVKILQCKFREMNFEDTKKETRKYVKRNIHSLFEDVKFNNIFWRLYNNITML